MEPLSSDEELFGELTTALAEEEAPPAVRAAGLAAWSWRDIERELATLVYDSAADSRLAALTRAAAAPRTLVFRTEALSLEVEVAGAGLTGQLVPPGPGQVEMVLRAGGTRAAPVDEAGRFEIDAVGTAGLVRLRCRADSGAALRTGWLHLPS